VERADVDASLAAARAVLGEATFATSWIEGRAMTVDEAVAYAVAEEPDPVA
jgi:hypothetical protein